MNKHIHDMHGYSTVQYLTAVRAQKKYLQVANTVVSCGILHNM